MSRVIKFQSKIICSDADRKEVHASLACCVCVRVYGVCMARVCVSKRECVCVCIHVLVGLGEGVGGYVS